MDRLLFYYYAHHSLQRGHNVVTKPRCLDVCPVAPQASPFPANTDSPTGRASSLHTCTCGGITWPTAVFSSLMLVIRICNRNKNVPVNAYRYGTRTTCCLRQLAVNLNGKNSQTQHSHRIHQLAHFIYECIADAESIDETKQINRFIPAALLLSRLYRDAMQHRRVTGDNPLETTTPGDNPLSTIPPGGNPQLSCNS